jgi:membrane associated rhomboid family serine protease
MIPLRDDNPTTITPFVTIALIAANVVVFFYQMSLGPEVAQRFVYAFAAIPAVIVGSRELPAAVEVLPPAMTLVTSMFLHGSIMHLGGNMLYLWIFGNNIEEAMGHARYVVFYLVAGMLASAAHIVANLNSTIPSLGASGAISGVLGAYLLLYPRAQVLTLIPLGFLMRLMYIPAGFALGIWFLLQLLSGSMSGGQGGGVAWWAHIGGFVAGMALVGLFKRRSVRFFNPPHYHRSRFENW